MLAPVIFLAVLIFCFVYWSGHSDTETLALTSENAVIQIYTNYFYYFVIVLLALITAKRRSLWPVLVILVLFCLREQDLHKIYHGISFLKEPYYTSKLGVPLSFKLLGGALIICLAMLAAYLISYGWHFLKALRLKRVWAITAFFALAALFISKSFDGMNRTLALIHMHEDDALPTLLEETLELSLPILIALAALQFVIAKDKLSRLRLRR